MEKRCSIRFIDTESELAAFCHLLENSNWLAIDTEFLREKTYFPVFCLLQVANDENVACIDPIALPDLKPLLDILYNSDITKILHSGRQDLEIFYNLTGQIPTPVFDTQIAAPLLGLNEQIGYADFISEILGVNLKKGHTRTDWSRRPLSSEQLQYAVDDVVYLGQAYLEIHAKLERLGRLAWLKDEFAAILNPGLYETAPCDAWLRIKAARKLSNGSLSILQQLAEWREHTARTRNMPRNWLLKDEVLVSIARLKPASIDDLKILRGLHERTIRKDGKEICERVKKALHTQPTPIGDKPESLRKSGQQDVLINFLTGIVHQKAIEHSINPGYLAGRKDLEQLVAEHTDIRIMNGWRKNLIGDELSAILRGEKFLSVVNGILQIDSKQQKV